MTHQVEVPTSDRISTHKTDASHHSSAKMLTESNEHAYSQRGSRQNDTRQLEAQGVVPKLQVSEHSTGAPEQASKLPKAQRDSSALDTNRFAEQALRLMPKIDTNNDGTLSAEELKTAMQKPQFKGLDAEVIAALYRAESALTNLSGQDRAKGVTAGDLAAFSRLQDQDMQISDYKSSLVQDFTKLDTNHDGHLSKDELSQAIKSGQDKDAAQFFLSNFEQAQSHLDFGDIWQQGLSTSEINNFKYDKQDKVGDAIAKINGAIGDVYKHQGDQRSEQLWGPNDDWRRNIRPEAIAQGDTGDCYFLSAMAAVAKANPETIHNMIQFDPEKQQYKVTFPGDKSHPVYVTGPTEMEQGLYNSPSQYGSWAGILEKAYGKYLQDTTGKNGNLDPAEAADPGKGGLLTNTMHLLTGKNFGYSKFDHSVWSTFSNKEIDDTQLKAILSKASKQPICCGTNDTSTDPEYPAHHAYTVMGFDPNANNGAGEVIVRNPWGKNDAKHPDGISHMTLSQFKHRFQQINYPQD